MPDSTPIALDTLAMPDYSGVPGYYSNSMNIVITNWDFRMLFGEIMPAPGGKGLDVVGRVSVLMSPGHFKAFLGVMNKQLAEYEKIHGEIKWSEQSPVK